MAVVYGYVTIVQQRRSGVGCVHVEPLQCALTNRDVAVLASHALPNVCQSSLVEAPNIFARRWNVSLR